MSKRHRYKRMERGQFDAVTKRNWVPVAIVGPALPSWMQGIPQDRLLAVYGSGSYWDQRILEVGGDQYQGVVGGIDVYRYDPGDELKGYPVNQDHYIVVMDYQDDNMLLVAGPIEQDHRWLERLPEGKPEIVIYEFEDKMDHWADQTPEEK